MWIGCGLIIKRICDICHKVKQDGCDRCSKVFFKGVTPDPFYQSYKWRKKSKDYRLKHPLCVHCLKEGRTTISQMVDHIIPISKGGDKFNDNNLQALCNKHHAKKTGGNRK